MTNIGNNNYSNSILSKYSNSENKFYLERPQILFCTGSKYTGEWNPVGMNGNGIYTLPNGLYYSTTSFILNN